MSEVCFSSLGDATAGAGREAPITLGGAGPCSLPKCWSRRDSASSGCISLVFLKPAGLPPRIQPDRPAEPGHGPGFSHAPVAQTRRPAGSPQSSASLAASAWSTRTLGWPSKAVSWRGHPHGVKQGIESPKPTTLVPVHQGVISPRHPTEDSRLNEGSTVLFRKESSFDLKPSL